MNDSETINKIPNDIHKDKMLSNVHRESNMANHIHPNLSQDENAALSDKDQKEELSD